MRLDPHDFTLTPDLSRTNNRVFPYRHRETHITMLRNCRIGLQEDASNAYVIADGSKLRNCVPEINLYLDWVA